MIELDIVLEFGTRRRVADDHAEDVIRQVDDLIRRPTAPAQHVVEVVGVLVVALLDEDPGRPYGQGFTYLDGTWYLAGRYSDRLTAFQFPP